MRAALLGLLACFALACRAEQPQSVVLIVVDTLRADHMGLYGSERPTSPRIDALAAEGRVYERAFATSPWTLPSFGTILTGLAPSMHEAGMLLGKDPDRRWDRKRVGPLGQVKLDGAVPTLAEELSAAGLTTLAVIQNPSLAPTFGLGRGFDLYDYHAGDNKRIRRADAVVDRALSLIDETGDRPFFLLVHLFDPHLDYDAPPGFRGLFTGSVEADMQLPVGGKIQVLRREAASFDDAQKRFVGAAYDEEIRFVDEQVGRLLAGLEDRELREKCLVLFTADHGEEFFEHGGFEHGHSLYNELLHVPLILWGPGVKQGRVADPVSIADIPPTVLDALGLPIGSSLIGESLWGRSTRRNEDARPRLLLAEGILWGPELKTAIRWPYKLIVTVRKDPVKLFDLDRDPAEQTNLLAARADLARSLQGDLERALRGVRSDSRLEPAELDQKTLEKLRALGYLADTPSPATRRLQSDQRASILARLATVDAGSPVWFSTYRRDRKAEELERELEELFLQAGWEVRGKAAVPFRVKPGLYVFMAELEPPEYARVARAALEAAGLPVTTGTGYRRYYAEKKRENPAWKGFPLAPEQSFVIVIGPQE